jgi:hypothetical protein
VENLESRLVPSGFPSFDFFPPPSLPATSLEVIVPQTSQVGVPEPVKVIALTASNQRAFGYTGTIHFTSTDGNAQLPPDFTFGPWNFGAASFKVTFETTGTQTLTATDTVTSSITGSGATLVTPAPVATHFLVVAPPFAATGQTFTIFVTALDASNHKVPTYTGSVQISSSDTAAVLPNIATLVSGSGKFTVTLNTSGTQTVSATDTSNTSLTGSAQVQVAAPGVAVRFVVFAEPRFLQTGQTTTLFVAALDANNHLATTYPGTVHFMSSDTAATLPGDSTLTSGIGIFSATLVTTGHQTITVTDVSNSALTGTANFWVFNQSPWHRFGNFGDFGMD